MQKHIKTIRIRGHNCEIFRKIIGSVAQSTLDLQFSKEMQKQRNYEKYQGLWQYTISDWLQLMLQSESTGPVSRKSRSFTDYFRVSQFPLYPKNGEDLSRQTFTVILLFVT